MSDLSIIIPTFNERENIVETIRKIVNTQSLQTIEFEILVVDDRSPDGTAQIVAELSQSDPRIHLILRKSDKGLSQSVVEGFQKASSEICLVMDADGSHPTDVIATLYRMIVNGSDISIGSRYMDGGSIKEWPLKRRIVSFGATFLGRIVFPNVTDPVSGFFAIRKSVLQDAQLRPSGYKILLEVLGKGKYQKVAETPYTFTNRKAGASKLGMKQIREYAIQVLDIVFYAIKHRNNQAWEEISRILKFITVGASGIVVNLMMLYLIVELNLAPLYIAWLLAIESSIISNFILNDVWTFPDLKKNSLGKRIFLFHVVSVTGVVVNFIIFSILTLLGVWYIVAELIAIVFAFAINFILNRRKTWKLS